MKSEKFNNLHKLQRLEYQLTDLISRLLFGETVLEDYQDLKLPSEDRPELKEPRTELKKLRRRRRNQQLQLWFTKPLKRSLLFGISSFEGVWIWIRQHSHKPSHSFENTYR